MFSIVVFSIVVFSIVVFSIVGDVLIMLGVLFVRLRVGYVIFVVLVRLSVRSVAVLCVVMFFDRRFLGMFVE